MTFDGYTTVPVVYSDQDSLVIGVNFKIVPHRFFGGGPSTLTRFSRYVMQLDGTVSTVGVKFLVDSTSLTFSNSALTGTSVSEIFVTDIPRYAARGRWIANEIAHSYPKENINLLGQTWVAKDTQTIRIKWVN
jgi:hypothetical protein